MASFAFNNLLDDAFKGNLLSTDTYYVMLTTNAYAADQDAHTKRSDVTSEVSGAGYTAGGQAIVPTFTKDLANNRLQIVFPQVTWASSTITARRAVYYKRRGGASSADELVAVDDFGADVVTTAGTFTLQATTINLNTPV
ncbi:MAG TPA: hypothetical protein VGC21_12775 [Telluria sp.]|jgi:hypothetical protein